MKSLLQTIGVVAALFILAVVTDQFMPLKQLTNYFNDHPQPYQGATIALSIIGWSLLIGVFVFSIWIRGRPMSDEQAREFTSTGAGRPRTTRVTRGAAAGREYRFAASFRDIKDAFRTGSWLHDRRLWPILIGLVGVLFAVYGMFGYFVVIGAPLVKLACIGALAYATIRTVWAFWKA
jgi:hypothetical protein